MCAYSVFNTFPVYPLSAKPLILLAFCRYRYHTSLLRDPLNRRPVIVVESQSVKDILPEGFLDIVHQPNTEAFNTLTEEKIKVSLIPFHVLDGGGVLLGIQPDRIEINGKESGAVLALSESALSDDNSYAAIINPEAIDSLGGEET